MPSKLKNKLKSQKKKKIIINLILCFLNTE